MHYIEAINVREWKHYAVSGFHPLPLLLTFNYPDTAVGNYNAASNIKMNSDIYDFPSNSLINNFLSFISSLIARIDELTFKCLVLLYSNINMAFTHLYVCIIRDQNIKMQHNKLHIDKTKT